jgi:CRP-like cAMP-binding protein
MLELGVQERVLALRRIPSLSALPTHVLVELAHTVDVRRCPRGARLASEGQSLQGIAWILEGEAEWSIEGTMIGAARTGASIGLLELCARSDARFSARAITPAIVASLSADDFAVLLEDSFDLTLGLLRGIASELCGSARRTLSSPGPAPRCDAGEVDLTDRIVLLRATGAFARAPIRSLATLAQRGRMSLWPRGARLWSRGSEARSATVLFEGSAREGRSVLGPGDAAGLIEMLASRRHQHDALVYAPAKGLCVDRETLLDVLEDDDQLALELLAACATELLALRVARRAKPDIAAVDDRSAPEHARVEP